MGFKLRCFNRKVITHGDTSPTIITPVFLFSSHSLLMNTCTSCNHFNVYLQSCIYTLVPVSVNYSLIKLPYEAEMSEANLRDYLASVFTNIEHGSS